MHDNPGDSGCWAARRSATRALTSPSPFDVPPERITTSTASSPESRLLSTSPSATSSSGTMPQARGSHPSSATESSRIRWFESNTSPTLMGSPGATISSPVDITATCGRLTTSISVTPTAASTPVSRADNWVPPRNTTSPRPMSDPAKLILPPGTAARVTRIPLPSGSVSSTITTASAFRGTTAPVAIGTAVPASTSKPSGGS